MCRLPDVDDETWSEVRAFVESNPDTVTLALWKGGWGWGDGEGMCDMDVWVGLRDGMKMIFF